MSLIVQIEPVIHTFRVQCKSMTGLDTVTTSQYGLCRSFRARIDYKNLLFLKKQLKNLRVVQIIFCLSIFS